MYVNKVQQRLAKYRYEYNCAVNKIDFTPQYASNKIIIKEEVKL